MSGDYDVAIVGGGQGGLGAAFGLLRERIVPAWLARAPQARAQLSAL